MMKIEDTFGLDAVRESQFASEYLGFKVEFVADVSGEVQDPAIPTINSFSYSSYPDDRDSSTSVYAIYGGLPTLGKGRR